MYIPTWVDVPLLIATFMILYEIIRKDSGFQSIKDPRTILTAVSLAWAMFTIFGNRAGPWSVACLVGSLFCLGGAIYFRLVAPPKLPNEPSID